MGEEQRDWLLYPRSPKQASYQASLAQIGVHVPGAEPVPGKQSVISMTNLGC